MYICRNKDCEKLDIEQNPGGRLMIKDGKSIFTGSKCKGCGKEMEHIKNDEIPKISFVNPGDARNW